jgi:hypothetical protein
LRYVTKDKNAHKFQKIGFPVEIAFECPFPVPDEAIDQPDPISDYIGNSYHLCRNRYIFQSVQSHDNPDSYECEQRIANAHNPVFKCFR